MLPPELQQTIALALKQLEQYRQALHADEEQARKKRREKTGRIAIACAACLLAAGLAGWLRGFEALNVLVIALAAAGLLVALIYSTKPMTEFSTAYEDAYKAEINNAIVKHISPALSYIEEDGIPRETFDASGLFDTPDRYGTSDLVSGAYGKTHVKLARVFAEQQHTTGTGKSARTTHTTIFDGVMLIASAGKTFHGYTHVLPHDGDIPDAIKTLLAASRRDHLAQLDNPEFENEFSAYTDAPGEARAILTAPMMERLLALKRRGDTPMRFCFKDSSVIIAIDNNDADDNPFDPDFDWPATDAAQLGKIHERFAFYLGIVDDLDLNTRLWSKE